MKTTKILLALAIPAILVSCSKDPELPYELEETIHTFAVSASKSTAHDLLLNAGSTDGDFYVKLDVPQYMGDYSSYLKEAQLLCVYTPVAGGVSSAIAAEGITTFPTEVKIDMPALCSKLGIASPKIGDKMQFTTNLIHKDGTVIPGWTPTMGFNYRAPSFFTMADGSDYSYCATFQAAAPLQTAKYVGGNNVLFTESLASDYEASYPAAVTRLASKDIPANVVGAGFTADDYIGLKLVFDWYGLGCDVEFYIYINAKDYSVTIPNQVVYKTDASFYYNVAYGYGEKGEIRFYNASGELDTQTNILTFSMNANWDILAGAYNGMTLGFGSDNYQIDFSESL